MMNGRETDLEVGGSIVISNTEETVIVSRGACIAEEKSAEENTSRRHALKRFPVWKIFKSIVFLICLIVFIIQSVEFLTDYYKYPTKIETEITVAKEMKLPAVTLCFRNTISFKAFCLYEPDHCEKPSNMEEFCSKYPIHCEEDNSTLKVPVKNYKTRMITQRYLFNDSYNDADLFWNYRYTSNVRIFVRDFGEPIFLKCYSDNLHLYHSGSKPETKKLDFVGERGELFSRIQLNQMNIEPFFPLAIPQVFLAIHSPYVPLDPEEDFHPVKPGWEYNIYVQLEKEEHLLPPPYQTDCRDNGPSKAAKESTNPNSFQMCLDLCRSEFYKAIYDCVGGMSMSLTKPDYHCSEDFIITSPLSPEQQDELKKKRLFCFQNCKQGCLKLQYKHTIQEYILTHRRYRYTSRINFYVKNPEVTVLQHVPLYGSSEIFSNVGGLLGCWLGVSVFTFTDILEKFFRKVVRWKKRFRKRRFTLRKFRKRTFGKRIFRKRKEQRAPPNSEIHQE